MAEIHLSPLGAPMYQDIALTFGPEGYEGERLILRDLAPVVLVVGPNGSGKSRLLKELKTPVLRVLEGSGKGVEGLELTHSPFGGWSGSVDGARPGLAGVGLRLPSSNRGLRWVAARVLLKILSGGPLDGLVDLLLQSQSGADILSAAERTLGRDWKPLDFLRYLLEALGFGPGSGVYEALVNPVPDSTFGPLSIEELATWAQAVLTGEGAKECIESSERDWDSAVEELLKRVPLLTGRERLRFSGKGRFSRPGDNWSSQGFDEQWPRLLIDDPGRMGKLSERLQPILKEGHLGVRLTDGARDAELVLCDEDPIPFQARIDLEAWTFFQKARPIERLSDGQRSWLSLWMHLTVEALDAALIDEPEAFLHPPLCRDLGRLMATQAKESGATYVIATHSPDILMGCAASGVPVHIIRLTYDDQVPTARALSAEDVGEMIRNPHLRSSEVLSAIFHRHVLIVEGGADRAFYGEINERLLRAGDERGISDCILLNANGKQNVKQMLGMLRKMGIASAAIVDFDVLVDGALLWRLVDEAGASESDRAAHKAKWSKISQNLQARDDDTMACLRCGGLNAIGDRAIRDDLRKLLSQLAEHGLFLVPNGALESWLLKLDRGNRGGAEKSWLSATFEAMGGEGAEEGYLGPGEGDVWDFLGEVRAYLGGQGG